MTMERSQENSIDRKAQLIIFILSVFIRVCYVKHINHRITLQISVKKVAK